MKRRYAVIGSPVRHSRSPWLHGYFARLTQRAIVYAAYEPRGGFADCAAAFFAAGGCGLNITLPYKAEALAFADSASAFARQVGAANVLARAADGGIKAYNTDGGGLLRDLQGLTDGVSGKTILLLGAGGAARAAAYALAAAAPAELRLYNRTPQRAQALAEGCGGVAVAQPEAGADIIIHATSAGHGDYAPYPAALFSTAQLAYDLSYGAAAQPFIRQAKEAGAQKTADGSGMLAWQAALSFALWEGVMPTVGGVLAAAERIAAG